ncbi:MAG: hypothetical protein AB7K64_13990 [Variibacter sp.]
MSNHPDRREAIRTVTAIVAGVVTTVALPSRWTKPVIQAIVGPAAAANGLSTFTTFTFTTFFSTPFTFTTPFTTLFPTTTRFPTTNPGN